MSNKRIREDFAIDALALEAERRGKKLGRQYSYGQLVADTTIEERERIAEAYRLRCIRSGGGTKSAFLETEQEAMESIRKRNQEEEKDAE